MTVVGYSAATSSPGPRSAPLVRCAGVQRGDIVHNAYGYGLFTRRPRRALRRDGTG